jgi:hypothetical protein
MKNIFPIFLLTGFALAQSPDVSVVPVTAAIVNTQSKKLPNGKTVEDTTIGKYYRDGQGRTRTELANRVVIRDPSTRTTVTLDTSAKTARVSTPATESVAPVSTASAPANRPRIQSKPTVSLGTRTIEGVEAEGYRAEVILPVGAFYNVAPMRQVSELWQSKTLRLPILVTESGRMSGERSTLYKDIVTDAQIDPALFTVPFDFQVIGAAPAGQ